MSEMLNSYVDVTFDGSEKKMVTGVYQYDHGLKLRVHNFPVSAVQQAQFGCRGGGETLTVLSTMEDDAVVASIPDTLLLQSREVICYLYYESEDVGLTVFEIYIPVMPRLKPASAEYTPEQVDTFDQLVAQLQALIAAVDDMEFSVNAEDGCLYLIQPQ